MTIDRFTSKPVDKPTDNLSNGGIGEYCDECGTELIDRCVRCGAPICCPKCCKQDSINYHQANKQNTRKDR